MSLRFSPSPVILITSNGGSMDAKKAVQKLVEAGVEVKDGHIRVSDLDRVLDVLAGRDADYKGHGKPHTGYTGFTNFEPGTPEDIKEALTGVFTDHPDAVVVDGDEDWYAPKILNVGHVAKEAGIKQLASFHSGVSGISASGMIIDKKDLAKFKSKFKELSKSEEFTVAPKPNYSASKKDKECSVKIYTPDGKSQDLKVKCKVNSMF